MHNTSSGKFTLAADLLNSGMINQKTFFGILNGEIDIQRSNNRIWYTNIDKKQLTLLEQEIADLQTIGYRE